MLAEVLDGAALADEVTELYRYGDDAERRGVLRGLAALPSAIRAAGLDIVKDALRANDIRLVAAAMGEFGARHLDDHAWRHGVLKCLFVGVPLAAVADLDRRTDAELLRMVGDYADERRGRGPRGPARRRRPLLEATRMRIFDPHIHMTSRTTDDYEAMFAAGVRALVEPSFWLGQPRTSVASFTDYFDGLIGWERFRAAQFGIRHHCTIALNPKEANDPALRRGARRAAALPRQGRRRRGRRGRLRLDDAGGGRACSPPSWSSPSSTSCPRWCTPRTGTSSPARSARSTWCASPASTPAG